VVFSELMMMHEQEDTSCDASIGKIVLMDPNNTRKAEIKPEKRSLGDYEDLF